jgi:hypothetical protein
MRYDQLSSSRNAVARGGALSGPVLLLPPTIALQSRVGARPAPPRLTDAGCTRKVATGLRTIRVAPVARTTDSGRCTAGEPRAEVEPKLVRGGLPRRELDSKRSVGQTHHGSLLPRSCPTGGPRGKSRASALSRPSRDATAIVGTPPPVSAWGQPEPRLSPLGNQSHGYRLWETRATAIASGKPEPPALNK